MSPRKLSALLLGTTLAVLGVAHADTIAITHLDSYRLQGIEQVNAERGRELWFASVNERSCSDCHGVNTRDAGEHVRTAKLIEPMALSVNPARYQNAKKIEKWFLRNCKWTFGRECSLQEKADILGWLGRQ